MSQNNRRARRIREQQRAEGARQRRENARRQAAAIDPITYTKSLDHIKHSGAGRYYVRVMNSDAREVVREVPSREELDRITIMRAFLRRVYSMKL